MRQAAPLNALRAFEAAARTGSFTNAARELGVSSAAVSQQVKLLEEHWGKLLFIRQGNRIALTDAGQTAYPQLAKAMAGLEELSDRMQHNEPGKKRLVLSVPQAVAETWLAPKLSRIRLSDMRTPLCIRIDSDPIDFVRDKVDMRLFYGHDLYRDYRVETLFSDQLIAVAAPQFAETHGTSLASVEDRHLIHTDWGPGYFSSPDWNSAMGDRIADRGTGLRVQSSGTALAFARLGFGVALVPGRMAEGDLISKRVVRLDLTPIKLPQNYMIAYPKRVAAHPLVKSILWSLRD